MSQLWQFPLWSKGFEPHVELPSLGDLLQEDEPLLTSDFESQRGLWPGKLEGC